MREMSIREANQNFSRIIALAEAGETIIITKNGKRVATLAPVAAPAVDAATFRREARERLRKSFAEKPRTGFRVGTITEDDKYDDNTF
jgi:prevent-host-death family protein